MCNVLEKGKALAGYLHKSESSKRSLSEERKTKRMPFKSIPQPNDTRWDCEFECLQGILHLKDCLISLVMKREIVMYVPTIDEFLMIEGEETRAKLISIIIRVIIS